MTLDDQRTERQRIEAVFADRDNNPNLRSRYAPLNPAHLFMVQQRQRAFLKALKRSGISLPGSPPVRILEVGSGSGEVLFDLVSLGASVDALNGVDLLARRAKEACLRLPGVQMSCADGSNLPFRDNAFDIVLQSTVFSSIVTPQIRQQVAREMGRVLAPDGLIIWHDYWINPFNPHVVGIRKGEIRRLFPDFESHIVRTTLAPPIARLVAPRSWIVCHLLEALPILRTHLLVTLRRKGTG